MFAVLIGAIIIFFAWKGGTTTYTDAPQPKSNSEWQASLKIIPQAYPSKTLGATKERGDTNKTETTTTAVIARELMVNYAIAQSSMSTTTMSDNDAELFVQSLLDNTAANEALKQYTVNDILLVDASTSTVELYRSEVTQAINTLSSENTFNELLIVAQAVDAKDGSKLKPLTSAVSSYKKIIKTLLSINTPRSATNIHLHIIQSYATILSGVEDMQKITADPAQGLRGIAKYSNGVGMLAQTATMFAWNK